MKMKSLDQQVSVSEQVTVDHLNELASCGVEVLVCNRPDQESAEQPLFSELCSAAKEYGIEAVHIPFTAGKMDASHCRQFAELLDSGKRIHAYCRTGNRASQLWAAAKDKLGMATDQGNSANKADLSPADSASQKTTLAKPSYDVVIVGAGSGGIAVSASLLKRKPGLRIALIDPSTEHFYQPGWTMVGGGIFDAAATRRETKTLIPHGATWIKQAVTAFSPEENKVILSDGKEIYYQQLVVTPGLKLNWSAIEGLPETLGKNGVTSNYRYDLAPYTWRLVQALKQGKAIFTQPPMPIKCAGAPQKALYLSADYWLKNGVLKNIDINFYNAGAVLFGVDAYVPALMSYIEKYHAKLHFTHTLTRIDGETKQAWFKTTDKEGKEKVVSTEFDMIHVCPPQCAPDFVRQSTLADAAGWLDVDQNTLQHKRYSNIWGLGDVMNTPNAKTMAAVRMQVPVVAQNITDVLHGKMPSVGYNGYGSCPLTVERGKVVLAEFAYGGKLVPSFPGWINNGTKPTRFAWFLKARMLPTVYWHGMLKGREFMASPKKIQP